MALIGRILEIVLERVLSLPAVNTTARARGTSYGAPAVNPSGQTWRLTKAGGHEISHEGRRRLGKTTQIIRNEIREGIHAWDNR